MPLEEGYEMPNKWAPPGLTPVFFVTGVLAVSAMRSERARNVFSPRASVCCPFGCTFAGMCKRQVNCRLSWPGEYPFEKCPSRQFLKCFVHRPGGSHSLPPKWASALCCSLWVRAQHNLVSHPLTPDSNNLNMHISDTLQYTEELAGIELVVPPHWGLY